MRPGVAALLWLLAVVAVPVPVYAHTPPDLQLAFHVAEDRVDGRFMVTGTAYRAWFQREAPAITTLTDAARVRLLDDARRLLADSLRFSIDGIVVAPVIAGIAVQESHDELPVDVVTLSMSFGLKGPPRQLSITWLRYDAELEPPVVTAFANLSTVDDFFEFELSAEEPEYLWHAPRTRRATVSLEAAQAPPLSPVTIHWLSVVIFGAVLAAAPWWSRRLRSWALRGSVLIIALALSWSTWGVGQSQLTLPWRGAPPLPDATGAAAIFESLHRNIYRAFDYRTEDEIYDALARSVSLELLDEIYDEVFQSLILREEGGAICTVRAVQLLECDVDLPPDGVGSEYHVRCRWRVKGTVEHWGHTHLRTNEYRARYTVGTRGPGWRITGVEIQDQQRVDKSSEDDAAKDGDG